MADAETLHSKFRGCLMGVLLGDCLGFPFELRPAAAQEKIDSFFATYGDPEQEVTILHYSDDTAMTRTLGWSLVKNNGALIPEEVAANFAEDYFRPQPNRLYGAHVRTVFHQLRSDSSEPFKPAHEQFNGCGSFGNGGAMRVAPVALLYHEDVKEMKSLVTDSARITHAHRDGINGAILQALAVVQALNTNPTEPINPHTFISDLISAMMTVERPDNEIRAMPFVSQLRKAQSLLQKGNSVDVAHVISSLGNEETALRSVVTAIYCFLRAQLPDSGIKGETSAVRAIRYAIELGGDTDTIAAMAGSIAGACFGEKEVPAVFLRHCEELDDVSSLADKLFHVARKKGH